MGNEKKKSSRLAGLGETYGARRLEDMLGMSTVYGVKQELPLAESPEQDGRISGNLSVPAGVSDG